MHTNWHTRHCSVIHLCFGHARVGVSGKLLHIIITLASVLSHLEGETLLSEPQVLSGHKTGQEDIDSLPYAEGQRHDTVCPRLTVEAADEV